MDGPKGICFPQIGHLPVFTAFFGVYLMSELGL